MKALTDKIIITENKEPNPTLTLYLIATSADSLSKQFGPGSSPTKWPAQSGSKLFETLDSVHERIFKKKASRILRKRR